MFIPLPREILLPYRIAQGIYAAIRGNKTPPLAPNRALEAWRALPEEALSLGDQQRRHVQLLQTAIDTKQVVDLGYRSARGPSARAVLPERLYRKASHLYLEAFCLERGEQRRFRLDQITAADLNTELVPAGRWEWIAGPAFAILIVVAIFGTLLLFSPLQRYRAARALILPAFGIDPW